MDNNYPTRDTSLVSVDFYKNLKTLRSALYFLLHPIAISLFLTTSFCLQTKFFDSGLYIFQYTHHLQIDRLLKGHLSLSDKPVGIAIDWAWGGNGTQHVAGMGVPFLELPFEIAARVLGYSAFPDRIFAALFLLLSLLSLSYGLRRNSTLIRIGFPALLLFSPPLLGLCSGRFEIYENVIFIAHNWTILCIGLLLQLSEKKGRTFIFLTALALGFSVLIRPTQLFYAVPGFLTLLFLCRRHYVACTFIFSLGPICLLILNNLRFGSPFSFGYELSISTIPWNDFSLRFDYPFQNEPFLSVAKELFGALFTGPVWSGITLDAKNLHAFQSSTLRFREYYSAGFHLPDAIFFILGIVSVLALIRKKTIERGLLAIGPLAAVAAGGLILFYLRSPSFSSRYMVDFLAALTVGSLPLFLLRFQKFPIGSSLLAARLLLICWTNISYNNNFSGYPPSEVAFEFTQLKEDLAIAEAEQNIENLSEFETCPSEIKYHSLWHLYGWNRSSAKCEVTSFTSVISRPAACLAMTVAKTETCADDLDPTLAIQAKRNSNFMELKSNVKSPLTKNKWPEYNLLFCDPDFQPQKTTYDLFSIGWVRPDELWRENPCLKLLKLHRVETYP
jgi:hypothetical protein